MVWEERIQVILLFYLLLGIFHRFHNMRSFNIGKFDKCNIERDGFQNHQWQEGMISNTNNDKKEKERRKSQSVKYSELQVNVLVYFNVIREVWV